VINRRCGVCQDFAHAMVALCRCLGIPCRYVSGYFFDATRNHSLRGSEASHAWTEVYIPGHGWIGLDPTNNKVVDETYVAVAVGRDYRDVTPVAGTYLMVGERTNVTGSAKFANLIKAGDYNAALSVALDHVRGGAALVRTCRDGPPRCLVLGPCALRRQRSGLLARHAEGRWPSAMLAVLRSRLGRE
jgi:transglutaminase-like putative cysteine protease